LQTAEAAAFTGEADQGGAGRWKFDPADPFSEESVSSVAADQDPRFRWVVGALRNRGAGGKKTPTLQTTKGGHLVSVG
jgi:hypothetical protein